MEFHETMQNIQYVIDLIDLKFPQCIMVAYQGCYAMVSP